MFELEFDTGNPVICWRDVLYDTALNFFTFSEIKVVMKRYWL